MASAWFFTIAGALENYATWAYKDTIYINTGPTGCALDAGSGNSLHFPLLVRLVGGANFNFSLAKANGTDLRFESASGRHLPFEIERWCTTCAPESAEIWVSVDTILPAVDNQKIFVYWGNGAAGDSSSAAAVFDTANGFVAVWHLKESQSGVGNAGVYNLNYASLVHNNLCNNSYL